MRQKMLFILPLLSYTIAISSYALVNNERVSFPFPCIPLGIFVVGSPFILHEFKQYYHHVLSFVLDSLNMNLKPQKQSHQTFRLISFKPNDGHKSVNDTQTDVTKNNHNVPMQCMTCTMPL